MRIIDQDTNTEITNPDLSVGELRECVWASPEAYASIDNVTKFALDDSDYETVMLYHRYTEEDIRMREEGVLAQEKQELMDALPDAVAELSEAVSLNTMDTADVMDAIAELSEIVSTLAGGE